ncbi:MAG: DEAD/DEAH box helicase [Clostridia bacterium]
MEETRFSQLEISELTMRAIDELGFTNATEIQAKAIPLIMEGGDVIGRSQTGSGKTIAFAIPALELVMNFAKKNKPLVLVLCPTRELALQCADETRKLTKYNHGIKIVPLCGGMPMPPQLRELKQGASIIIGTPGRVMDHIRRGTLNLEELQMIVLDEADEMLSMGFKEDIETILEDVPNAHQTVLFSATMPPSILNLTKTFQQNPKLVEVGNRQRAVDTIKQSYYNIPMGRKNDALSLLLAYYSPKLSMIFCNTKSMVENLTEYLQGKGFSVDGIHGDLRQGQRLKVLNAFKTGRTSILVATDVAARGIDVDGIDYVFNYDIPQNSEYYIHRIGRTGRAGKDGSAITLCSGRGQVMTLMNILRFTKSDAKEANLPSQKDIDAGNFLKISTTITDGIPNASPASMTIADNVLSLGLEPKDLIASLIEMNFKDSLARVREIKTERREKTPAGNKTGRAYQKVSISIGRSSRIAPKHIVGALTEKTDLCGGDIGKIDIYDDYTVVGIPTEHIDETLTVMDGSRINGEQITLKLHKSSDTEQRAPRQYNRDAGKSRDRERSGHFSRENNNRGGNFSKSHEGSRDRDRYKDNRSSGKSDNRRDKNKPSDKARPKKMSYKEYSKRSSD